MVTLKALTNISTGKGNYHPDDIFQLPDAEAQDCLRRGCAVKVTRQIKLTLKPIEKSI